jgi:hypothetical protein
MRCTLQRKLVQVGQGELGSSRTKRTGAEIQPPVPWH